MAGCNYVVRQAVPADVREGMMQVWRKNLPVHDAAEKYRWFFEDAPEQPKAVFVLYALTEGKADEIVGTSSVGIRRFSVNGKTLRVALLADLAINKEHRQLRWALNMVREVRDYALRNHAVLYGFPNHKAVGVFRRAGCKGLGSMPRYARVLRHAGYIERLTEREDVPHWASPILKSGLGQSVLGAGADVMRMAELAPKYIAGATQFRLQWIESDDARIDDLWQQARSHYPIVGERTSEFLSWRFPKAEGHRFAALVDRKRPELRAYAVVLRSGTVIHMRDFFGFPDDIGPLIRQLLPILYGEGVTSISVRFLGAKRFADALRECGFAMRQGARDIVVDATDAFDVSEVEQWFLSDGDEDA